MAPETMAIKILAPERHRTQVRRKSDFPTGAADCYLIAQRACTVIVGIARNLAGSGSRI